MFLISVLGFSGPSWVVGLDCSVLQVQPCSPKVNSKSVMEKFTYGSSLGLRKPNSGHSSFSLGIPSHVFLSVLGSTTLLFAELHDTKCHSGSYGRSVGAGAEW